MGLFDFIGNVAAGVQGSRMGKKQMQLGRDMMKEAQALSEAYKRPEMQTPAAIRLMADMAQGRMFQNMPGMNIMQNQINQATAGAVEAMKGMGVGAEAFGGIADVYANQMNQQANLATQNAAYRDDAARDYMGVLNDVGQWQQSAWQWNEADPYLQAQQKAAQLEMMGRQGQWEGLKTKMGSWAETFKGAGSALDATFSEAFPMMLNKVAPGVGNVIGALTSTPAGS